PDGPTIAKNSPLRIVRSTGPSACTACPFARAGNRFVTPPSVTCACITGVLFPRYGFADVLGQEVGVDHLGDVDVAFERADGLLNLDDPLHSFEVDLPV